MTSKLQKMLGILCLLPIGSAEAEPTFFADRGELDPVGSANLGARFRADSNDWDLRLAADGFADNGDTRGDLGTGRPYFEGYTFDFELRYVAATRVSTLLVARDDRQSASVDLAVDTGATANTFQLSAIGSQGDIYVTSLSLLIEGSEVDIDSSGLSAATVGSTDETFLWLGDGVDLYSNDFSLIATVGLDTFDTDNPSDGVRFDVNVFQAGRIPAPATAMAGMFLLLPVRRPARDPVQRPAKV
ncbi:MAG: hypothetical protein AAF108_04665 [Planctomycetota bacterium]